MLRRSKSFVVNKKED